MYIAIHNGEKKGAWEVPPKEDAECPGCGGRVRVWREGVDGTARHFGHVDEHTGCGYAESDDHRKWKNFAAERLSEVFTNGHKPVVECRLKAPHSDKAYRYADVAMLFEDSHDKLGEGIAVEVQHKNTDKNKQATTRDYAEQGLSTVWLTESDFETDGCRLSLDDFIRKATRGIANRYTVSCPNCGSTSGPYSPSMVRGGRMCSCGISFAIDTVNQTVGRVLSGGDSIAE